MAKSGKRIGPPPSDSKKVRKVKLRQSQAAEDDSGKWVREAVESIAIAIMLAFLFRAFEAEAFVIPTGSMAPTLQGMHKDIECPECGYQYQVGASKQAEYAAPPHAAGAVIATTCPMCRHTLALDVETNDRGQPLKASREHASVSGDRILVSKFAYQIGDPQRWDVIVFKYPGNAKQNFIKRLVGLPNEVVQVFHGDVLTRPNVEDGTEADFAVATKPPRKLVAMLQPVHDTRYIPQALINGGYPSLWEDVSSGEAAWETEDGGRTFHVKAEGDEAAWLRYRHRPPTTEDWEAIQAGETPPAVNRLGEAISDFYAYNAFIQQRMRDHDSPPEDSMGMHWVGDLALECELVVESSTGKVAFDLVEAGRHHTCTINLADGMAVFVINDGTYPLGVGTWAEDQEAPEEEQLREVAGKTPIAGPGSYNVRFANADDELILWVDEEVVLSTKYARPRPEDEYPHWSEEDPGDLMPAGVAVQSGSVKIDRLRVLRDVYYIAPDRSLGDSVSQADYARPIPTPQRWSTEYQLYADQASKIRFWLSNPELWDGSPLWAARGSKEYEIGADQFFPMGDNCPQSQDGRFWYSTQGFYWPDGYTSHVVPRELLTGKAFVIYWPHPLNIPLPGDRSLPIVPNVPRMGLVR